MCDVFLICAQDKNIHVFLYLFRFTSASGGGDLSRCSMATEEDMERAEDSDEDFSLRLWSHRDEVLCRIIANDGERRRDILVLGC